MVHLNSKLEFVKGGYPPSPLNEPLLIEHSLLFHLVSQADVPTAIGVGPAKEVSMETDSGQVTQLERKYYIDSTYITVPREEVEINTPLRDGLGEGLLLGALLGF